MKMYHASLAIIFNHEEKVLLSKRFEPKYPDFHGKWQLPGGGIEPNETLFDAAIREAYEEANIEIKLLTTKPMLLKKMLSKDKNERVTLYGFPAIYVSGTISCENDPESSELDWFEYNKINFKNTLSGTKEMIDWGYKIWKKH